MAGRRRGTFSGGLWGGWSDLAAWVGALDRQEGRGLVGGRRARVGRGVGGHGGAVAVGAVGVRVSQKWRWGLVCGAGLTEHILRFSKFSCARLRRSALSRTAFKDRWGSSSQPPRRPPRVLAAPGAAGASRRSPRRRRTAAAAQPACATSCSSASCLPRRAALAIPFAGSTHYDQIHPRAFPRG